MSPPPDWLLAVPVVAAVAKTGIVSYAEAVTSMSASAADPRTRRTIDEFNQACVTALQVAGGARRGKAILLLNPADPPMPLRCSVFCLVDDTARPIDRRRVDADVRATVDAVAACVPGYRLRHRVQFETVDADDPLYIPETGKFTGTKVTALLEIAGRQASGAAV